MVIKVILLLVFFAVMLGIGFYSRKHATDVKGTDIKYEENISDGQK